MFRVLIKHCILMGKNIVEVKQWLDKHYMDSARQRNQQSSTDMPNLNALVQTLMTLNALVTQNQQLFRKT